MWQKSEGFRQISVTYYTGKNKPTLEQNHTHGNPLQVIERLV